MRCFCFVWQLYQGIKKQEMRKIAEGYNPNAKKRKNRLI
jgi:hypothetical protein